PLVACRRIACRRRPADTYVQHRFRNSKSEIRDVAHARDAARGLVDVMSRERSMSSVLIVDDEPAICWAFREALTDDGHAVHLAASAEEALRLTDNGCRPDAVVMDVRLPGMD